MDDLPLGHTLVNAIHSLQWKTDSKRELLYFAMICCFSLHSLDLHYSTHFGLVSLLSSISYWRMVCVRLLMHINYQILLSMSSCTKLDTDSLRNKKADKEYQKITHRQQCDQPALRPTPGNVPRETRWRVVSVSLRSSRDSTYQLGSAPARVGTVWWFVYT